ncbi:acyl-CoA N-acyltransferase [Chytriomyces cf. hyalinus JEL632]|nr:acyl-CoA N-acyltransferase [Chytriomyces cf. hyalinus JEL632]
MHCFGGSDITTNAKRPQPAYAPTTLSLPKGRFILSHPLTEQDDEPQNALFKSPEFTKYLPNFNPNPTLQDTIQRRITQTADRNTKVFSIRTKDTNEFVGSLGLYRMEHDNKATEAGLAVFTTKHRSGIASEALFLLLNHAFTDVDKGGMGFNRVTFVTNALNAAMRGWLEKAAGATQEALFRDAWRDASKDTYFDSVTYAILKREWEGTSRKKLLEKVERYFE